MRRRTVEVLVTGIAAMLVMAGGASAGARVAAPEAPVPETFRAQATAWTSDSSGWVLGTDDGADDDGDGGDDGAERSPVIRTVDSGRTWSEIGSVPAPLAQPAEPGVTELAFADERHGWAYGPSLYSTRDGGRSWSEEAIPEPGGHVVAMATSEGRMYMVVSPCEVGTPPYDCDRPSTVWRSLIGSSTWIRASVELPVAYEARVAVSDGAAYVVVPTEPGEPDVFYATTDGWRWSERSTPCRTGEGESLVDVAAMPGQRVALLCIGGAGWSKSVKRVFVSDDAGQTTAPAGVAPEMGIRTQLAAGPDDTLLLASTSSGSWLYRNAGGGAEWTTPLEKADGGADWNDPMLLDDGRGFVVHAPAAWADGAGTLLTTRNGGQDWSPVAFRIGPMSERGD
ncbi:hypothetical protein [Phytoactinopolyspora halotolerans]|uniref:Exo-alpha-sialidase n=1 Tax=Phytoactinopolyspora halotolerans TaxID=1981512 RepID=A0A6L9S841_9ACTN|nr:hypothetical protein [Phytoactinopolyspora halotolerans]NEE00861.1 hypothetical protein [Phytoactinopolyspora halotolerans]